MFSRVSFLITFGNREAFAGVVYFVLGVFTLLSPSIEGLVWASVVCGSGMKDCGGVCIPESHECCPDGTHGDSTLCCCCTYEGSSSSPTITCLNEGETL